MSIAVETAVCKTVRSMGLSAQRTQSVVDGVTHTLSHNGVEWVLGRIKALRDYYADPKDESFPRWVSRKRRPDGLLKPKGWLGKLVGAHTSCETSIALLGTLAQAIVLDEPSSKQLDKFAKSVTEPPTPTIEVLEPQGLESAATGLERRLKMKWSNREFFGPADVKGTKIPLGRTAMKVKYPKNRMPDKGLLAVAWDKTLECASASCWQFLLDTGYHIPGTSLQETRVFLNKRRKDSFDSGKRHPVLDGKRRKTKVDKSIVFTGEVNFLQQPSGKLRTVANPNRFAQWCLEPFGEVLSDWVNSQPGIYVLDQAKGIEWIQRQLANGEILVSADLSSASDTLDYKAVIRGLKQSCCPILSANLRLFETLSQRPWYLANSVARREIGETITWKQGQPLGLRPSFPILTLCNLAAAQAAVIKVDGALPDAEGTPFAIVGDDIVIKAKYAVAYTEYVCGIGGIMNLEKSMTSFQKAEFCSRLITANKVIRLKPRYLFDNDPNNVLTYQSTGVKMKVKGWVKSMCGAVGNYALKESGLIPCFNPTHEARLQDKAVVHALLGFDQGSSAPTEEVSMETFYLNGMGVKGARISTRELKSTSANTAARRILRDNPEWDVIELLRRSWSHSHKSGVPLALDGIEEKIRRRWDEDRTVPSAYAREVRAFYRDICLDPKARYESGLVVPTVVGHEIEADDRTLSKPASTQTVSYRTVYDYKTDSRVTIQKPEATLKSLAKRVTETVGAVMRETDRSHIIMPVQDQLEVLVEDKVDKFEISYHTPNMQTEPIIVEKLVKTPRDGEGEEGNPPSSMPSADKPLVPALGQPDALQCKEALEELQRAYRALNDTECSSDEDVFDGEIQKT